MATADRAYPIAEWADPHHVKLTDPTAIYADQVRPGMVIAHPDGCSDVDNGPNAGAFDVIAVTTPDDEDMVCLTSPCETVRLARDWPCHQRTAADADLEAALLLEEDDGG